LSPRTGRPPKEDARKVSLGLRLTENESQMIQECADALGTSRTDAIIRAIQKLWSELTKK